MKYDELRSMLLEYCKDNPDELKIIHNHDEVLSVVKGTPILESLSGIKPKDVIIMGGKGFRVVSVSATKQTAVVRPMFVTGKFDDQVWFFSFRLYANDKYANSVKRRKARLANRADVMSSFLVMRLYDKYTTQNMQHNKQGGQG